MEKFPEASSFEEFNNILKSKLNQCDISVLDIQYERIPELTPFDEWMRRSLDNFGITKIDYRYQKENGLLEFKVFPPCETV